MQITPTRPNLPRTPGDDLWMVRATLTKEVSLGRGDIVRFTAVDLDPEDTTPGVYPMLFEHGSIRYDDGAWVNDRHAVRAWNDDDARAVTAATYDAARAFLELRLPPTTTPAPISHPDLLRLELGDDTWVFRHDAAPAQAWAVLQAAMGVRELGAGRRTAA